MFRFGLSSLLLVGLFFFSQSTNAYAECSGGGCGIGVGIGVGRASFSMGIGFGSYYAPRYPAYYPTYYPTYFRGYYPSYYYRTYYQNPYPTYYRNYSSVQGGCGPGGCSTSSACGPAGCPTYIQTYQPAYQPYYRSYSPAPVYRSSGGCGPGGCPTSQLEPMEEEDILIAANPALTSPSKPVASNTEASESDDYVMTAKAQPKKPQVGIAAKNSTAILCEAFIAGDYVALVSVGCLEKNGARHNNVVELITPEKTVRATVVFAKNLGDSSAMPKLAAALSESEKLQRPTKALTSSERKSLGLGSQLDDASFAALETEYGIKIAQVTRKN